MAPPGAGMGRKRNRPQEGVSNKNKASKKGEEMRHGNKPRPESSRKGKGDDGKKKGLIIFNVKTRPPKNLSFFWV